MKTLLNAMFSSILLTSATFSAYAQDTQYAGKAYDLKTDELVYSEHHDVTYKNDTLFERKVTYKTPDDKTFATKDNRYTNAVTTPEFTLKDTRINYQETASYDGERWTLSYTEDGEIKSKEIGKPDNTPVIDAGFDEFVRANWEKLLKDKTVRFSFAVPSRLEWVDFRLIPKKHTDTELRVEMRLESRMLSWLMDPVQLTYEISTKRLLRYQGLTNILNTSEESIYADIRYEYPKD
ncbi:MAG: hypothetical protein P1U57_01715 [Oleibacter sp.]|nr:hypothetical protein [Thalassolituus sp.]